MASCYGLSEEESEQAILYYRLMLSPASQLYNVFHVYIYHVLCILGVVANACIVVVLAQPSMRKNPFNLFLIAIAVCDMSLMASYLIFKQLDECHPYYFSYFWSIFTILYAVLSVYIHSLSLWLTVNMAVLRFLVLRESSKSGATKLNNYRSALLAIIGAVLISLIGSLPNMLKYRLVDRGEMSIPKYCLNSRYGYQPNDRVHNYSFQQPAFWSCWWDKFSFWTAGLLLKIIPCILLTIFMALLVQMLIEARDRRSRLTGGSACGSTTGGNHGTGMVSGSKSQAERTTTMLVIIVAVFLVTELPQGILVIASSIQPSVRFAMPHFGDFVDLLSLLNSSVNFILYSTMSVLFRREFLKTFGFCFPEPLKQWSSRRKLKSNGVSTRGLNSKADTPTKKLHHRTEFTAIHEQTECLIENGEVTTNST